MKLNSELSFKLDTLKANAIWRTQDIIFIMFVYNSAVCEFNNFSIGIVNSIQRKLV